MKPAKNVDEYIAQAPKECTRSFKNFGQLSWLLRPMQRSVSVTGCLTMITKVDWFIFSFGKTILDSMYQHLSLRSTKVNSKVMKPPKRQSVSPWMKNCPLLS